MSHVRSSFSFVKNLTLAFLFIVSFSSLKAQYNYDGINPAHLITSWTGSPANFNSGTFNILAGQSAQVSGAMTLGAAATMNVQSGGTLRVTNGVTFTNNGTLNIAGGGTLELQGSGAVVGANAVTYQAANSLLLYSGATGKTTNNRELPTTMIGAVTMNNSGIVIVAHSTAITGNFTLSQRCYLSGAGTILSLNGNITTTSYFDALAAGPTLVIGGAGTFTGNLDIGGGSVYPGNLTMNRPGAVVVVPMARSISGVIDLTAGILRIASSWFMQFNSTPGAVINANANSYIDCPSGSYFRRNLPAGTLAADYVFPVGSGGQYLPFTLRSGTTVSSATYFEVEAFSTGSSGTPNCSPLTSLSSTDHWYAVVNTGTVNGDFQLTAPSVVASSVIGARVGLPATGVYTAPAGTPSVAGSTITNNAAYSFGTTITFLTVASNSAPTVYTFIGGNPNALASWAPMPPSFAVPCAQYVIPNGQTATLTANLAIGSGSSGSQLIVQNGGTLNTATFAVQIAGNNGGLTIQDGATLQTANTNGVNGSANNNGALQITAGTPATVTFTIGAAVNFSLSGTMLNVNLAAVGNKPAITNMANLTIGVGSLNFSSNLTLSGNFTSIGFVGFTSMNFTMNGTANVMNAGSFTINSGAIVNNPNVGGFTNNSNNGVYMMGGSVTGQPFAYAVNSRLYYLGTGPMTPGPEFPTNMPGDLYVDLTGGTPTLTLNSTRTLGASASLVLSAGQLVTSAANMLIVNNTAAAAVTRTSGMVEGPMRRALPAGGPTVGSWLFPVSKGGTYLPLTVNDPTTAGGATVEAEAFNVSSGGTTDGTTTFNPLGAEYWRAEVVGGSFTSGFVRIGKTGLAAENIIGSSTTAAGTYSSNGSNTFAAGTPPTLTRTVTNNLAAPTFFAAASLPSTYYYISGSPYTASNWNSLVGGGGVPAISLSGQNWSYVVPNGRTVSVTGVDLIIGSGASASQAIVEAGGMLEVDNGIGFVIGGNGGAFTLQAGGTLRARGGAGINGTTNNTGAIQIHAGTPGTVTVTYDPAANYIFSRIGGGPARTAAAGVKPAVTFANNVLVDATGPVTLDLGLTVNGNLTINAAPATAGLTLAGATPQILTLNGAANQLQAGQLTVGANFTIANTNPGGLTVLNGATVNVGNATIPFVSGNEFAYNAGGILNYQNTVPMTTGLEFPATMNGNVTVNAGGATPTVTLNAARTLGAGSTLTLTAGRLVTSAANMLTVNNTAAAAVASATGTVEGPMRRSIAAGANIGTWLFPLSKGAVNLPFALVDPNSVGGSVVETEAFNTNPVGTADGTTIQTGTISTTEYWRANVFSGGAITARMLLGRTTLAATQTVGSAAAIGGPYSAPSLTTYNNLAVDNLTQNTAQSLSSPNFFAVGTFAPPTTYYYHPPSGAPHLATSWWSNIGGTGVQAANMTTSGWTFIVPNTVTATATANIAPGAGVTLQVANGGTLNMGGVAVTGAGNFALQANGTLQTSRTDGVNGTSGITGAIQATGTITYSPTANYVLAPTGAANARFAAVGAKPAITDAQNLTINGNFLTTLQTGLALSGALTINCASVSAGLILDAVSSQTLALNGPGSQVQAGSLSVRNNFTVANNNGVTPLSVQNSCILFTEATALPFPVFSGNPINYASGAILQYDDNIAGTRNTGAELPPTMNGSVAINTAINSVITLSAPTTINGTLTFFADSRIVSTPTNLLTIGNTSPTAILGASATRCITGALARTTSIGSNTYLFPLGGGTAATYIPATFAYSGMGAPNTVLIEGLNVSTPGIPGGGLGSLSATEYWRVNPSVPYSNVTLTLTRNAAIPAGNTLSNSATAAGTYNSVASNIASPSINNLPAFASLAAGDGFYSIASPTVVYYYNNANGADPNNPANWDTTPGATYGTPAPNFTTAGTEFSIDAGSTAVLTASLILGSGTNNVTLTVPNGATLNTGSSFTSAIQFNGTGCVFNLQNGSTFITQNTGGVNGTSDASGAIQRLAGTLTTNYGTMVNFVFGNNTTSAGFMRFAGAGSKSPITQVASLVSSPGTGNEWTLSDGLTVNGPFQVQSGTLQLASGTPVVLTLNGASTISANADYSQRSGFRTVNNNTMTVQTGGQLSLLNVNNLPPFSGMSPMYQSGSLLSYGGSVPAMTFGAELPTVMNGNVTLSGTGGPLTLAAATTLNGTVQVGLTVITTAMNILTVANTVSTAITQFGTGQVQGPMRRVLPVGAGVGTWLFPVGKGGTNLPFAVNNPTTVGGATIEVEAYNTAPTGGTTDGSTIIGALGSQYWRAEVASGTFTSGFMQAAVTGLTAANAIGSSTTAPPTATTYASNGANTVGTLSSVSSLTRTVADNLAAPTYFAVGTAIPTYYYNNANVNVPVGPNNPANWDTTPGAGYGTGATNFTTANTAFSIDAGSTAVLTADLPFGAGANNVTLTVPSGATLNTGVYAVQFAGNNSRFTLQNGGTLQTSNANGINGGGNSDGAVQINPPLTTGVVISYGPTANYVLGAIGATTAAQFGDISGNKQAITQAASLTVNPGTSRTWILSGVPALTLSGALTVQSGILTLSLPTLNLSAAGSTVQSGASLIMNVGSQISNTGGLTVQNLASLWIEAGTPATWVTGTPVTYNTGSQLIYNNITSPLTATGLELPGTMFGTVALYGAAAAGVLTLSSPTTITGAASLLFGANGRLNTSSAMLTLNNPSPGALSRTGSGYIEGPFRRALLPGASIGQQWLFPIGKGGTYLPFAVNDPTTAGGATIEVEAYNAAPAGGSADGSTVLAPLGAEYWRAQVASGTFTSGFMQAARTGLTATNIIGGTTTAPPAVASYSSNGTNNVGTLTAVSSLRRTVADNLAAPTYFAIGTVPPPPPMNVLGNLPPFTPRPTTTPLMNTMNYGTPSGSPMKVPMNTPATGISVTFSQNATTATFNDVGASPNARDVMKVHGMTSRGYRSGQGFSGAGATMTFTTSAGVTTNFDVGEQVWVTVTNAQSTGGAFTRPFVMGFRTRAGSGPAQFQAQPVPGVTQTAGVCAGDFDGDGNVDVAFASQSGNQVVILRNLGGGVFGAPTTVSVGSTPTGIAAGDIDNDGDLDIAVTNSGSNTMSIIQNNGSFSFAVLATLSTSNDPRGFAFADFNADGILDIITTARGSSNVNYFRGLGGGSFAAGTVIPIGSGDAYCLTVADVDNDGDIDAIISISFADQIRFLLNDGNGNFSPGPILGTGGSPREIVAGDWDNDGDMDLAVANGGGLSVLTFINNPVGTFTAGATIPIGFGTQPIGLTLGDFDGNGFLDLATGNLANATSTILMNTAGVFAVSSTVSTGWNPISNAAADFDGDGDIDIMTANSGAGVNPTLLINGLSMTVQNNAPPFGIPPTTPVFNSVAAPIATNVVIPFNQNVAPATVNATNFRVHGTMRGLRTASYGASGGNATLSAISSSFLRGEQVWVSVTNAQSTGGAATRPFVMGFRAAALGGTGNFVDARRYPTGALPVNTVVGQFDNVAGVDFAVANTGTNTVTVYLNDGTGNFPPQTGTNIVTVTVGAAPTGLETGDFDNDGNVDIIAICQGSVWFIRNNNNGSYTPSSVITSGYARLLAAVADFNADGNLDIVFGNNCCTGTPGAQVYFGTGTGTFTFSQTINDQLSDYVAVDVADMDGDGDIDIIYGFDQTAKGVRIYRNDGTGKFDTGTQVVTGTAMYNMQVANLNTDVYPDIVYTALNAGVQQNVYVLLSTGAMTYAAAVAYPITNAVSPVTQLADIDGDGDLDILAVKSATTNGEENSIYTLKNNGSGVFTMFASSPLVGRSADALTGFAAADFDGDGDLDLAIPKTGDAQVAVVLNQTPRLQVTGIVPAANAAAAPEPITISPTFNLAVTGATYSLGGPIAVHGGMSAHRNITSGGAWAGSTFTPNNIPTLTRKFFPGEKIDVMISSSSTLAVGLTPLTTGTVRQAFARVLSGPGTFQLTQLVSGGGGNTRAVASGDWDNNGVLDLVMVNQNAANNIRLMMNNGSGNFTPQVAIAVPGIPSFPISGDFDNDGNLDVIVSSLGTNNAYIYRNSPAGTLTNVGAMSLIGLDNIASGDFNGDGLLDVVATCGANGVRVARNNGGMSFTTYQTIAVGNVGTCAAGDFDSDGDIDIVYSLTGSTTVGFLQNDGKGNFNTAPFTLATAGATRSFFSVGDLDSDGDIDLAIGGNGVANAVLLENTSSGGTLNFTVITTTLPSSDITLTDINGDGNLDLAAVYLTTANTLLNSGSGALSGRFTGTVLSTPISGTTSFCLTSGDFDNDGDMDIATANHGSGDVSILLNQVPPTVFYYQSGNANNPANWNSLPWGGGTPATAFSSPATDFYVMGGSATTTASVIAPITIGANVSMHVTTPSVLAIGNGVTITNNGFVNVSGNTIQGATLQLVGSGAVTGNAVTYWGTTATLEYQTILARATTNVEFPSPMQGSVLINGSNTVSLNANRQITGTLTVQAGTFDISGRTLQPNGAIVFSGGTINGSAAATLDIAGAGNITGSALFTGIMGSLSMNRAGATLSLGSPLDISAAGLLTLNQGFIQTTPTNILRTTNSAAGAIVGTFGANSHVMGPLRRVLAAAGTYSFPVGGGTAATYNPATLTYTAGGGTVEVEPFFTAPPSVLTSGLMGSLGSASEYWRVTPSMALTNADLTFQRVPGMTNGVNLLGVAPAAAGTYNGYTSTVVGSTIVNTTTFPTLAVGNGFYAVGTGVTTFFYRGGGFDPNIAGNWYTGLGGTGSPAPNFTGANYIFIVPNMTTAALTGNFTVANTVLLQVATGGVLDVGGFQVTGVGNFDLQNGATLQASNNNGFNGGAIVNTGTRTWSLAANYIFTPPAPYGTLRPLNIATAQVNNLTTLFGGTADLTANLQVNGIFTGGSSLSSCTSTLTLAAGTHAQTDEVWLGGTSNLALNAGATLNLSTAAGAVLLVGPDSGCGAGGNVSGAGTINYAANSTLTVTGSWTGTITQAALPATMNGNVNITGGMGLTSVTLGAGVSSQINGTLTMANTARLNVGAGNTLALNNAMTFSANSTVGGTTTSNLSIIGTGTITGALTFAAGAQTLNNFTLNRMGANPTLGSPLNVAGTLALTNGVITNTLANMLTVSNTAPGAVAAGSGYVDGFLERAFGVAGAYTFPVGQGIQALPMTFSDDGTGMGNLIVNAQTGGGGSLGTGMTSLYNTGRWEVRNTIGTRTGTVSLTPSAAVPSISLVGLSSALGGIYNSIGPVFFAGGASIAQTLPQNYGTAASYLGVGSGVAPSSRYYFMGGNASDPNQWNSSPTGSGSNAPSFLIPGVTFYVMGNTSGISTTVATMQTNTTLGMGAEIVVETPAVLRIPNGVTLTNNGTLTVRGTTTTSATLLLEGNTGGVTGNVVQYGSALARLQYSGSGSTRTTTLAEFPPTMPGTVIVDGNVTVVLDGNKTLQSALLLDGLIDMSNRNVVLQGRLDLRGAFIGNGSSDLEIGHQSGTPAAVQGSLKIATNILQNFTLNRPNTIVPLGSPLLIQGGFSLARGILRSDTTNYPIIVNPSFSGIVGGNDSSYVEGPLERYFPINILAGGAGNWSFPVGRSGRYLPFTLRDPRTGGNAPQLRVEAFTGAQGGSVDSSLSAAGQGEYWNVQLRAGDHTQSSAELGRFGVGAVPIVAGSVVAKAPVQSGVYRNIGGTVAGNRIVSGTFASFSTFTIGTPASGIPPAQLPSISSFGPQTGTSGNVITVNGTNFTGLGTVLVGGVVMPYTVVSPTQIIIQLTPGAQSGPITVVGTTSGSASSFTPFTFIGPPTMATVSPLAAAVGQDIIIRGNNFFATPTAGEPYLPVVRIGGITASTVEIISPTEMRVRFPASTSGNVTVQSWGGIATTSTVSAILPPPQVRTLGPSPVAVGDTVTITGQDFRFISALNIGGTIIPDYRIVNSTTITFVVPPGATTSTVTVRGAGGSTTSMTRLQVFPAPVISMVTPGGGFTGQVITLTGENFTGATAVRFGNTTATFTVSADGRTIQAIIPANVSTGASISVTTPGGTARSGQPFLGRPSPLPVITGFGPVPVVEGNLLTVQGENFPYNPNATAATVILGGVAIPGAYYTSSTTLVLRVPPGVVPFTRSSTTAILTLQTMRGSTNAGLQVPVLAPDAPVITRFTPDAGDSTTMITIEGRNFGTSPRNTIQDISIGGVPVASFVVLNGRIILTVAGTVSTGTIAIRTPGGIITTTGTFRFNGVPTGGVARQDSLALATLYNLLGGEGWTNRTGWPSGNGGGGSSPRDWYGVVVGDDGRVRELNLSTNNVRGGLNQGRVDSALAQLSGLRVLDLSGNGLTGVLPRRIGTLRLLERLNLSKNKLEGDLKDLCGLQQLRDLDISSNNFRDSLANVLCCLVGLERANVSNNRIFGGVPLCLTQLTRLTHLDASWNELTDSLPAGLGVMTQLTQLNVRRNRLTGTLPGAWGQDAVRLAAVAGEIGNNKNGSSLTAMTSLQVLNVGANRLTGSIPAAFGNLRNLRTLALDSNNLSGSIPEELTLLGRLTDLHVQNNGFSEAPDFSRIARLADVRMEENRFEFGALEPQSVMLGKSGLRFTYSPQAEVGQARDEALALETSWVLDVRVSGTQNRYEWRKRQADGSWARVNVPGIVQPSASSRLRFASFQASDAGEYRCFVTNSLLPGLTLVSRAQTLRGAPPTGTPEVPIVIEPENGETTALRPVLVWTSRSGAAAYDVEVSERSDFGTVTFRQRVAQTLEALETGSVEAVAAVKLAKSTRYFWRVASRNSVGMSVWSTAGTFTTAEKDIAFTARIVEFGRVPRLDTGLAVVRVRNVADSTARLFSLDADGIASRVFGVSRAATSAQGTVFARNEYRDYAATFLPEDLVRYEAGLRFGYAYATPTGEERDTWTQGNRLRGRGSALKLVAPQLDTMLIGLPRVSAALLINRSTNAVVEVEQTRIVGGRGNYGVKGSRVFSLAAGDTVAVVVRSEAREAGAMTEAVLEASGMLTITSSTPQAPSTQAPSAQVLPDTARVVLRGFARRRQPWDMVARLGVRPTQSATQLPPGTRTSAEVYLNRSVSSSRDSLFARTVPLLRGTVRYSNQVMSLSEPSNGWRKVENRSRRNRQERVVMPETRFLPVGGEVLAQLPVIVVAGDTTATALEIEDIRWEGVYLIEYEEGVFQARASRAGGTRLIGQAASGNTPSVRITNLSPNPAAMQVEVGFVLEQSGVVSVGIVDVRGQEVVSLGAEPRGAGEHTVLMRLGSIPSGTYTVQVRVGAEVVSRVLSVVR